MHTPIWLRILIAVDLLLIGSVLVIGWLSGEIAGEVVEQRLVQETARRTGEFLNARNLPFNQMMMRDLHRIHGAHFVTLRAEDGGVVGSSLSPELTAQFQIAADSLGPSGTVTLGEAGYRYDSHELSIRGEPSGLGAGKVRLYALVPPDEFEDAQATVARRIASVTPLVLAAASLLAVVLALTIARPIHRLAARMEATGTDSLPLREGHAKWGPSEVVKLSRSFDQLMARLAETRSELARSERLATLGRIAASVVHELRNPLSGIQMHIRVLQEELQDSEAATASLGVSLREIERMDVYLDELTDLACGTERADSAAPLRLESLAPVRIEQVADSALAVFTGRCRHAGVEVVTRYDPATPHVPGDAKRLRQVMMNLIVNALEAMPAGGILEVSTELAGKDAVRCTVADTGTGLQGVDAGEIFEPFVSTKSRSAGLGLYISRRIVEAHGGTMGCRNRDRGAAFWFGIPITD